MEMANHYDIPPKHEIRGNLILLRTAKPSDYPSIKSYLNDRETMKALIPFFKREVWTDKMVEERIQGFQKSQNDKKGLSYLIELLNDHKVVGSCGFKDIDFGNMSSEFGIILHKIAWGTGAAQEAHFLCLKHAFEKMKLKTVFFDTDDHNIRMKRFFQKVGIPFKMKTSEVFLRYEVSRERWPTVLKNLRK